MKKNWFSNFLPFDEPILFEGILYKTPEHFYQAMKNIDRKYRYRVAISETPFQAKRIGRSCELRSDWEEIKISVMTNAIRYKFKPGTSWYYRLMKNPSELIIEWNNWHDNFWGDCVCLRCADIDGQNHLGKIIMQYRDELLNES